MVSGRQQLRDWLHRSRQNQIDLARELEITESYLSQILSGLRRPKLETLVRIESLTGIPVSSWADIGRGSSDRRDKAAVN